MRPFKVALIEVTEPATSVPAWVTHALQSEKVDFIVRGCHTQSDVKAVAYDADLVWVWGNPVLRATGLDLLTRCGAILRSGSGTDNVPVEEATQHNILVVNTPGAVAQEVSDHSIALLLSIVRQTCAQDQLMRSGVYEFRREKNQWHLAGATFGLIGFGHIAQLVAQKMVAFGVRILVYDPLISEKLIRSRGGEPVDFPTLMASSDFISVHCPLTPETRHLINRDAIGLMKPHAILINTSRGPIVDEAALIAALRQKRIGGAGLDVFEEEPLPSESELLRLENVVLTPHIAGYSDAFPESFWRFSVESVLALANGYWPRAVVNPKVRPRWPLRRRQWPIHLDVEFVTRPKRPTGAPVEEDQVVGVDPVAWMTTSETPIPAGTTRIARASSIDGSSVDSE
jgi:D-3-phosphoglycerate dehydrogenase / 2-oxoglutarate reductase